jgi:hypothetical protein
VPVYVETQSGTTNDFGLINLKIGMGTPLSSDFSTIAWGEHPYFLKVEMDPDNGNIFTHFGTSQLLAVPYALHSQSAETLSGTIMETDPVFTAWDRSTGISITESQISDLSHNSLNMAYDEGGSGAGRTITSDAGAFTVAGTDGIISIGTFNSGAHISSLGAGPKMIWHPKKAAFRVGYDDGTHWTSSLIGGYSVAFGYNNKRTC